MTQSPPRPFIPETSPYQRPGELRVYSPRPSPPGTPSNPATAADLTPGGLGSLAQLLRLISGQIAPPWVVPPAGAQPFDYQGLIATPAIASPFTSIININQTPTGVGIGWTCPNNFYAVIRNLTHNIIGPGFVQGSGALVWQLQINNVPIKGFGNLLIEFGNPTLYMRPVPAGIVLEPGDVFVYSIKNVAYAAGGTQVLASINGWLWPVPSPAIATANPAT